VRFKNVSAVFCKQKASMCVCICAVIVVNNPAARYSKQNTVCSVKVKYDTDGSEFVFINSYKTIRPGEQCS